MASETTNIESYSARVAQAPPTDIGRGRFYRRTGKSWLDLALAIVMAPAVVPLILLLWLFTRCDSGPGFYVQSRVGRGGRVFRCYKLRTMVVDADHRLAELCAQDPERAREWRENQKLADDPRITRLGRFLRATSLDELPQYFNVLKGDMSFVGPRPYMLDQHDMYRAAGGTAYGRMRPGITGPWQLDGRGETPFADRVGFDEAYYRAQSLRGDLRMLLRTIGVVLNRTGT